MIINIEFTTARGYKYETMRTEFDRNYQDEETAMVFVQTEEDDFEGYFEVNFPKDENRKPTAEGAYVCEYESEDDCDPATIYHDVKITLEWQGFEDLLTMANAELLHHGLEIVLEYDGECYWAIGVQDKQSGKIDWYAEGDFEHEVAQDINECWAHARAKAQSREKKMYCVTYVGLSDSEYDSNGYSEVALYATKDAAKAKLKAWRDNEIAELKEQERDYEILEDEDDECRISWCGHGEQIRIEVHEVELNK